MLAAMVSDAVFIIAFFLEAVAVLSLLHTFQAVLIPDALGPVLALYRQSALPIVTPGTGVIWGASPGWAADATLIATVLFFQFFIRQARRAAAPYEGDPPGFARKGRARIDALIDWLLPVAFCAAGAIIAAPTLAPFLAVPAAVVLKARRRTATPCWFQVPDSFYTNLICLCALMAGILAFLR